MLYVFLHGLTVLCERTDGKLEIVLPRVKGHVFKAGNWLAETPIPNLAELELVNVEAGQKSVYGTGFLIDVPKDYPVTKHGRAATILAPKPTDIMGLLRARDVDPVCALRSSRLHPEVPYPSLAEVLVLVYEYRDQNQIMLDGHYWQPCAIGSSIALHIIATSEGPEGAMHGVETDAALRKVYRNFPGLKYPVPRPRLAPWMDYHHPNFGDVGSRVKRGGYVLEPNGDVAIDLAELEHPASRAQRLERLGRMRREKLPIDCLWRLPDPLCDTLGGPCGSQTGDLE